MDSTSIAINDIAFFIGTVGGVFIVSRVFLFLLRLLKVGQARFWIASALTLAAVTAIGGWGFANNFGGHYVPMFAFVTYLPASIIVLLGDLWWQARKRSA